LKHARANAAALAEEHPGRAGLSDGLQMRAWRARTIVFKQRLADRKSFAQQLMQPNAACNDVAAMLAAKYRHSIIFGNPVEDFSLNQCHLALIHT
jgi:hypothetical protein